MKTIAPRPLRVAILFVALTTPPVVMAQTPRDWGSLTVGSYTWTDSANWSGGDVPDSTTESARFNNTGFTLGAGTYNIGTGAGTLSTAGISLLNAGGSPAAKLSFTGGTLALEDTTGSNKPVIQMQNIAGFALKIANDLSLNDPNGTTISAFAPIALTGILSGSSIISTGANSSYLYLSGANTFTGGATFLGGGLTAANTSAFAGTSGTFSVGYTSSVFGAITLGTVVTGTTAVPNTIDLNSQANQVNFGSGGAGSVFNLAGPIVNGTSGAGAINIAKTTVAAQYQTDYGLAAVASGVGTVRFSGSNYSVSKNVTGGNAVSALELSPASGSQTWSGNITGFQGTSSIIKSGGGTVLFGGTNTYNSQTLINEGTLLINGVHADSSFTNAAGYGNASEGHFKVSAGATLGGAGRLSGNNNFAGNSNLVLVQNGGFLAPGSQGIGTLTLDGANFAGTSSRVLNMASGADFVFELDGSGGSSDRIDFWNYVSTDMLLNSTEINLTLAGVQTPGTYTVDIIRFFSNSGVTATTHAFASGLVIGTLDSAISSASIDWDGLANANQAIALTFTVVPEPTSAALLALGVGSVLLLKRRRI